MSKHKQEQAHLSTDQICLSSIDTTQNLFFTDKPDQEGNYSTKLLIFPVANRVAVTQILKNTDSN